MLRNLNRFIATGFFSGNLPGAPGTFGTLVGVVLMIICPWLTSWWAILVLSVVGIITTSYEESWTGIKDEQKIVIDEIAGLMITFVGIDVINWQLILIGFILFRFFDILKPFPIKQSQKLPSAWGVMLDDILAGLASSVVLYVIIYYF